MSTTKRGLIYLLRKRGRSILLFFIICIITVFTALGFVVKSSVDLEMDKLRKSLNSSFTVGCNYDDPTLYEVTEEYNKFIGPAVTDEMIEDVMQLEMVTDCFTSNSTDMWVDLELQSGMYGDMYDVFVNEPEELPARYSLATIKVHTQTTSFDGCSETKLHDFFRMGALSLSEGRHVEPEDRNVAIISSKLATRNNLKIGDSITGEYRESSYIDGGSTAKVICEPVTFEIIGTFDIAFAQTPSDSTWESNYAENIIYCDLFSINKSRQELDVFLNEIEEGAGGYGSATFYVDNPKNLNLAVSQFKSLYNINNFKLETENAEYRSASKPLKQLTTISIILIVGIIIACIVILGLILNMWIKSRMREIGILMSIGSSSKNIILQLLFEMLIITVIALIISLLLSGLLASTVGNMAEGLCPRIW